MAREVTSSRSQGRGSGKGCTGQRKMVWARSFREQGTVEEMTERDTCKEAALEYNAIREREQLVERVARAILHRRARNDLHVVIKGAYVLDFDKELARAAISECEKESAEKIATAIRKLED